MDENCVKKQTAMILDDDDDGDDDGDADDDGSEDDLDVSDMKDDEMQGMTRTLLRSRQQRYFHPFTFAKLMSSNDSTFSESTGTILDDDVCEDYSDVSDMKDDENDEGMDENS
jgi:hypothetical protein